MLNCNNDNESNGSYNTLMTEITTGSAYGKSDNGHDNNKSFNDDTEIGWK